MYKVLIVIPTFNESESIAQLIQRIIKMRDVVSNQYHLDVLVVDDNSPDGTADFVNDAKYQNVFVLSQNTQVMNVRSKRSNLLCDKFINNSLKSNKLA